MTEKEIILKYAQNEEERLLGRRFLDLCELSYQTDQVTHTGFLSQSEQAYLKTIGSHLAINMRFFGGYDDCERSSAFISPDVWTESHGKEYRSEISAILVSHKEALSHRDLLGAILGLGIKRQTIGDILVGAEDSVILVMTSMLPFLLDNFHKAAHAAISCWQIALEDVKPKEPNFMMKKDTVASERLDAIVASGFSVPRDLARKAIETELVRVNYRVVKSASYLLKEGDVVSMRGKGKFIVSSIGGLSKKGRIFIGLKLYV